MDKSESSWRGAIRLLLVLLAVPLVAFIAGRGIEWKLDSTLRTALLQQSPDKAADISQASVSARCSQPDVRRDADVADACNLSDNMQLVKSGAVIAAILGVALLVAIKVAGKLSKGSRILLLLLFAPGLHITMLVLSVLMVLHAALGMGETTTLIGFFESSWIIQSRNGSGRLKKTEFVRETTITMAMTRQAQPRTFAGASNVDLVNLGLGQTPKTTPSVR
jgi:membrane glycosyltransferase